MQVHRSQRGALVGVVGIPGPSPESKTPLKGNPRGPSVSGCTALRVAGARGGCSELEEARPMTTLRDRSLQAWHRFLCCPPPPRVTGVTAGPGGGSGEVAVTWDPLPASAHVAFYRVYERKGAGLWWHLAVVTDAALGDVIPGRLG